MDALPRNSDLRVETPAERRGIGPWTTAMATMLGAGDPDALPASDLGIKKAWKALAGDADMAARAHHWQPWRAYAANLLWRSLT